MGPSLGEVSLCSTRLGFRKLGRKKRSGIRLDILESFEYMLNVLNPR